MTDPTTLGYEAEPQDVALLVEQILGDAGDPDERYSRATAMQVFHRAVASALMDERADICAKWNANGESYADIADRISLSRGMAQKLVERGRAT